MNAFQIPSDSNRWFAPTEYFYPTLLVFFRIFLSAENMTYFEGLPMDHFILEISEAEVKREREKSRELRKSRWWKNRLAHGLCHYCGQRFSPEELTMDHLVPVSRGGKASRNNVVPACKECNTRKKYLLPIEWEEYLNKQENPPPEPTHA